MRDNNQNKFWLYTNPKVIKSFGLAAYNTVRKYAPNYQPPQDEIHHLNKPTIFIVGGLAASAKHLDLLGPEIAKYANVIYNADKDYINESIITTDQELKRTYELARKNNIIPANSDVWFLGHSNGGISCLRVGAEMYTDVQKIITLSSPHRGLRLRKENKADSNIISHLQTLDLKGIPYDCHTTSLDVIVPHDKQIPSESFMSLNPQTRVFYHNENHWPFHQMPGKFAPKIFDPTNNQQDGFLRVIRNYLIGELQPEYEKLKVA